MRHLRISPILWGVVLFAIALTPAASSSAGEDVDAFLQALYKRNYFDTALEYIDQLKTSPLVDEDTKKAIPLLHARTEQYQARAIPDARLADKEAAFRKAIASYLAFTKSQPNHPRAVQSLVDVGAIYRQMAKARTESEGASVAEARGFLKQSEASYAAAIKKLKGSLQALIANPPNPDQVDVSVVRTAINAQLVGAEFELAEVAFDTANTYKEGDAERKRQLGIAAERFEEFFDDHGDLVIGMQAIVRAGQCYRDMGNIAFALSCFESILDDPDLARLKVLRPLRLETIIEAMVLWTRQIKEAKKYSKALPIFERAFRISELRGKKEDLQQDPRALSVLYQRAKLAATMANRIKAIRLRDIQKRYRELIEYATETFKMIAETEGKHQTDAIAAFKKIAPIYKEVTGDDPGKPKDPGPGKLETFADILKESRKSYQRWTTTLGAIAEASGAEKAELEKKSVEQLETIDGLLRMALDKSDADTSLSDLSDVYSRMAIVYWYQKRYPEAAVVGEHLARRYPEAMSARTSADIALKSWNKMYETTKQAGGDIAFEQSQIVALGMYVSERWSDSNEAADALYRMIAFALEKNDLDAGLSYLARMPETAPHYPSSQLILGRRVWRKHQKLRYEYQKKNAAFQKQKANLDEAAIAEAEAELATMKAQLPELIAKVEPMLSQGLAASAPNPRLTYDALFLAELFTLTNRPEKAVKWLENNSFGPLKLLDENAAIITQQQGMPTSIYRTGLQSYAKLLAAIDADAFPAARTRFDDLMVKLKASANNPALVTSTYHLAGKIIEENIAKRAEAGDEAAAARLTEAFKHILVEISSDKDASHPMLFWVARSLRGLGAASQALADNASLDRASRDAHKKQAAKSYGDAAKAYESLAKKARGFRLSENQVIAINLALAECQLGMEEYGQAITTIQKVLDKKPNYISAQLTAAKALQLSGSYKEAILGKGEKKRGSSRRPIWGWRALASKVDGDANYQDAFFEASLSAITCMTKLGRAGDAKSLSAAKRTLRNFKIQQPTLGGPKWKPLFEAAEADLK